jgi:hypothetical protein
LPVAYLAFTKADFHHQKRLWGGRLSTDAFL